MAIGRNPFGGEYIIPDDPNKPKPDPTPLFGDPSTYGAAVKTQGSDYDRIMAMYADIAKNSNPIVAGQVSPVTVNAPGGVGFNSITPQLSQYSKSPDVSSSIAGLKDLSTTGGYSDAGIADLRARGISPTRSIYASAQRNVERQRALQGGYSPNFGALQAKMARDESNQIGDINTSVNAGIAQNVASNRIAAAPGYASAASAENAARTASEQRNADIINQINEANRSIKSQTDQFNASMQQAIAAANANSMNNASQFNVQAALDAAKANAANKMGAAQGSASLYGTNPALINTFGNQVTQAAQVGQGQQQLNNQKIGLGK